MSTPTHGFPRFVGWLSVVCLLGSTVHAAEDASVEAQSSTARPAPSIAAEKAPPAPLTASEPLPESSSLAPEFGPPPAADESLPVRVIEGAAPLPAPPPSASSPSLPPSAAPSAPAPVAPVAQIRPVTVELNGSTLFSLRLPDGKLQPKERARRVEQILREVADRADPDTVRLVPQLDRAIVFVGPRPLLELTRADAEAEGEGSLDLYAASVADRVREALRNEQERSATLRTVLNVILIVFLGVLLAYGLRRIGALRQRLRLYITSHRERIGALHVGSVELLGPQTVHAVLAGFAVGLFWLIQLGLAYGWLLFALSRFDATRGLNKRLAELVLVPLSALLERILGFLPVLFLSALGVLAVLVLLRFTRLYFEGIAEGRQELAWLPRRLARPTSLVLRTAIVLLSLIFLTPIVTGNTESVLSDVGLLATAALVLAAAPVLINAVAGVSALYTGGFLLGRSIELGSVRGTIERITWLALVLRDPEGREIHVPHLLCLLRPVSLDAERLPRLEVTLRVSADAPQREVLELIQEVCARHAERFEIELRSVGRAGAEYLLCLAAEPKQKNMLMLDVTESLKARRIELA